VAELILVFCLVLGSEQMLEVNQLRTFGGLDEVVVDLWCLL
jgi:hypothetical protein